LWQSYCKNAHAVGFVVDSTHLGGDADLRRVQGYFEGRRKSGVGDATLMPQKPNPARRGPGWSGDREIG
jgi:hypothetical protein